jgi:chromate transport protein ChrA
MMGFYPLCSLSLCGGTLRVARRCKLENKSMIIFLPSMTLIEYSLPGALGMYGLSIGVSHIGATLPRVVYAFLSGLNAAVVGVIALAAVQLAQKAITDKLTRILVFLGASAGLLYNALWYFPVLMFLAGCTAVVFDYRVLHGPVRWIARFGRRRETNESGGAEEGVQMGNLEERDREIASRGSTRSDVASRRSRVSDLPATQPEVADEAPDRVVPEERKLNISWQLGTGIIILFFITFVIFMVLRGTLQNPSIIYSLFANMYLAGTIIFGGGPVVIPLLREYVVAEGWVSPRDFLIGLAIIQAFPGPNFNFAVYLGSLTAIYGGYASAWGALVAYIGIFVPGLVTVHGEMGLWSALRSKIWVKSALRGINAAAVGLIYTAVYRLWQIGWIDEGFQEGVSLANDPWWVVVTATSYVGGYWFGLNAPMAIALGAIMGLIRYGVVTKEGY